MHYREIAPPPYLAGYVRCFWALRRDYRLAEGGAEHLWPDGGVELLFHYGDRYCEAPASRPLAHGFLIGPMTRYRLLSSPGEVRLFGARFHPWGVSALFRLSAHELRDALIPAADLFGAEARALEERLYEAGFEAAATLLAGFLRGRLTGAAPPSPAVAVARELLRAEGRLSPRAVAEARGLCLRQLERGFNELTGMSPKRLCVIARFDAARRFLIKNPAADLSGVAYRFGYSDYAHLSKDFSRLFGMSPRQFARRVEALPPHPGEVVFLQDTAPPPP
jgi:AraC-like DNA-binding protein